MLFSFLLVLPLILPSKIIERFLEVVVGGIFIWIFLFTVLKTTIKEKEIEEISEILKIRYKDRTFIPLLSILITIILICFIPLSLFFEVFFDILGLYTPLESLNTFYLTYILVIFSFPVILGMFMGISTVLTDLPIKIYLKLSKSELSVFEWFFYRKISNKQIYQSKEFATQYSFFTITKTSFIYIILVASALYTLYYGLSIALRVEISGNSIEIIMGLLAMVIFVNTLFWNYYKRKLFINELGLVEEDPKSKLIKKIDPSLFEKSLKSYLAPTLVFPILTVLPELPQIIDRLSNYYEAIIFISIILLFFIVQLLLIYIDLKTNNRNEELKKDLLQKNNILTCKIQIQLTQKPGED